MLEVWFLTCNAVTSNFHNQGNFTISILHGKKLRLRESHAICPSHIESDGSRKPQPPPLRPWGMHGHCCRPAHTWRDTMSGHERVKVGWGRREGRGSKQGWADSSPSSGHPFQFLRWEALCHLLKASTIFLWVTLGETLTTQCLYLCSNFYMLHTLFKDEGNDDNLASLIPFDPPGLCLVILWNP